MFHFNTLPHWLAVWRRREVAAPAPVVPAPAVPLQRPSLDQLAQLPLAQLPACVRACPVARKYLALLGALDWTHFPERPGGRAWPGPTPAPRAPFVAAYLVKLTEGKPHFGQLHTFLVEHPALVWVLGFPLVPDPTNPWGFDVVASLPSRKHLGRVLRELDNAALQFLLTASIHCLSANLPPDVAFGEEIALDTKHIIAWVKENNPKVYQRDRYEKQRQPRGDPDCKLGFKPDHNGRPKSANPEATSPEATNPEATSPEATSPEATNPEATNPEATNPEATNSEATNSEAATPTTDGQPASSVFRKLTKGQYYWGYASGVVATKIAGWGEVVLAEVTQTFDHSDPSYFFPLMARTEANLGFAPPFGALDKAFDAFFVYAYFAAAGGFAAVPWADSAAHRKTFTPEGLPLCAADLPMPRRSTYWQKSNCLVPHEDARYGCPLRATATAETTCPVAHANWAHGGCVTTLPTSPGNRIRHELDRESAAFKALYGQRTTAERINSQALALGIERPHLRNGRAIANLNTLIYVLINLRTLQRIQARTPGEEAGLDR